MSLELLTTITLLIILGGALLFFYIYTRLNLSYLFESRKSLIVLRLILIFIFVAITGSVIYKEVAFNQEKDSSTISDKEKNIKFYDFINNCNSGYTVSKESDNIYIIHCEKKTFTISDNELNNLINPVLLVK
ncbi:hypothetical protein ABN362_22360 [Providencia alcalifaciens]|uniref:hypothetical protein n=1 Tax=Providencia alcalifaciens TaxID=126385 RepID=UPI0032DA36B0